MDRKQIFWIAASFVWLVAMSVVAALDWVRIGESGLFNLVVSWNTETTLASLLLCSLPALVMLFPNRRIRSHFDSQTLSRAEADTSDRQAGGGSKWSWSVALQSVVIAALSILSSWGIGQTEISVRTSQGQLQLTPFADLPPAYHDEYSYLLQAETFRAGRLSWPGVPVAPDEFHQFHVLNEDVTISRYFPLTGLWVAPFLAANPIWGHWVAGALAAVFFFWSARLLMPAGIALFCGVLIALSPGLAIFSNMLLAHHPVMLLLSIFLFSFLKLVKLGANADPCRKSSALWALFAGCAMSAAMLGRPMTAAGFTAPFGAWLLVELIRRRASLIVVPAFALPLLTGFSFLAVMNHAGTGDAFRTAYQEYTDSFTPRHKYGFDNALHCEVASGPEAVKKYDQWATNLNAGTAAKNIWLRTKFSLFWIWNAIILSMGLAAAAAELIRCRSLSTDDPNSVTASFELTGLTVLIASVFCLHLVHIPYWYAGIMEWHYVFETAPLILLLAGFGLASFHEWLKVITIPKLASAWLVMLVICTLLPAWFSSTEVLGDSKVDLWINQTAYSRRRMAEFRLAADQVASEGPVLVLVDESNTDPQLSFIINPPNYEGPVIVCRLPQTKKQLVSIVKHFDDRRLYYFDASQQPVHLDPFNEQLHLRD